jgi:hypothetical protein
VLADIKLSLGDVLYSPRKGSFGRNNSGIDDMYSRRTNAAY